MRTIRLMILTILLAPVMAVAEAETSAPAEELSGLLGDYRTFQADFHQVVTDGSGSNLQQTKGSLMAKRPGLFFWQSEPPMNQIIVADGNQVTVYDPDLEQVTIREMDQRVSQTPALMLSGEVESLSQSYKVEKKPETHGVTVFELRPRSKDSLFLSLRLHFKDDVLREMRLKDSLEQLTIIGFENIRVNEPVNDGRFELDYPESVDVIRDTR